MVGPSPTAGHHLMFLAVAAATAILLPTSQGGQCWSLVNRNGRCTESLRTNVTREECCSDGSPTTAWSSKDLRPGDLFFWISLGGGVACKPCKVYIGRGARSDLPPYLYTQFSMTLHFRVCCYQSSECHSLDFTTDVPV
ncbi:uncharacterized protein LOC118181304, partial [Stegodyphus dumicola]|uniref:uncharacterized protein LOC118181304 n=1 Tax=Stegodyphus dumicola TaxID=202533 RepID=UPI0015ACDD30